MQDASHPFQSSSMDDQHDMPAPPTAVYHSLEELLTGSNHFAASNGYKLVVVRSKTNAAGQKTWVHLACDRHGTKRNTHNLTPETRKKNRRSRRCECPMYCVAVKQANGDLWELQTRHAEHNHGPYEPPAPKKKDLPKPHASEVVNLPALQTPSACLADFCLVPVGTGNVSVASEVAEVQRLLKRTGLNYSMHSFGTTVEGSWDDVTRFIGQAHSLLHGSGVVRIQTHINIASRTDKKQGIHDKVDAVNAILQGMPRDVEMPVEDDDNAMDDTEHDQSMSEHQDPNIQPGLDQHRIMSHMHQPAMQANMGNIGQALQQGMAMQGQHDMTTAQQMQQLQQHSRGQMSHSPHPLSNSMSMQ